MIQRTLRRASASKWMKCVLAAVMMLCVGAVHASDFKSAKVYMFGFAATFNDSTVYFTDIQTVNDAWVYEKRRDFLVNRNEYSYQLRKFLQSLNIGTPTCVTIYAFSEKEINKKYAQLRKRYEGKKRKVKYLVVNLPAGAFAYQSVDPSVGRVVINPEEAEAAARRTSDANARAKHKAEKKARKAARKAKQ